MIFIGAVSATAFTGSTADSNSSRLSSAQTLFRVRERMVSLIPEFFISSNLSPPQTVSFRFISIAQVSRSSWQP